MQDFFESYKLSTSVITLTVYLVYLTLIEAFK